MDFGARDSRPRFSISARPFGSHDHSQDSMSRERRHMAGVTWEGGSVVLFGALGRVYSRRPWPCLRFRTNDVLLGTSGVGVRFSVVSIQLFRPVNIFYFFGYIGFDSTSSDPI